MKRWELPAFLNPARALIRGALLPFRAGLFLAAFFLLMRA
jgi:hypothetical protein